MLNAMKPSKDKLTSKLRQHPVSSALFHPSDNGHVMELGLLPAITSGSVKQGSPRVFLSVAFCEVLRAQQ